MILYYKDPPSISAMDEFIALSIHRRRQKRRTNNVQFAQFASVREFNRCVGVQPIGEFSWCWTTYALAVDWTFVEYEELTKLESTHAPVSRWDSASQRLEHLIANSFYTETELKKQQEEAEALQKIDDDVDLQIFEREKDMIEEATMTGEDEPDLEHISLLEDTVIAVQSQTRLSSTEYDCIHNTSANGKDEVHNNNLSPLNRMLQGLKQRTKPSNLQAKDVLPSSVEFVPKNPQPIWLRQKRWSKSLLMHFLVHLFPLLVMMPLIFLCKENAFVVPAYTPHHKVSQIEHLIDDTACGPSILSSQDVRPSSKTDSAQSKSSISRAVRVSKQSTALIVWTGSSESFLVWSRFNYYSCQTAFSCPLSSHQDTSLSLSTRHANTALIVYQGSDVSLPVKKTITHDCLSDGHSCPRKAMPE